MADSLDDFFAKKDKKRAKDKPKGVLSAEALVKELEEGSKQADFPDRKSNKTLTTIELLGLDTDDADWRDFEDVEKRDYTGLKVKEMSLQDQNEDEQRRLGSEQIETIPESTPWKIKDSDSTPTAASSESAIDAKQTQQDSAPSDGDKKVVTAATAAAAAAAAANATIAAVTTATGSTNTKTTEATSSASQKGDGQASADSEKKVSDSKPSAKAPYRPPAERLGEVKILEPTRLTRTKATSSRQEANFNIQDEEAFPSLG